MLAAVGTPATAATKATLPIRRDPMSSFFKQIFYCEKVGNIIFDGLMFKSDNRFLPDNFCWIRKQARKRLLSVYFVSDNLSNIRSLLYTGSAVEGHRSSIIGTLITSSQLCFPVISSVGLIHY